MSNKKGKIKKILNTKIFYFILGAIIFGSIGVSAATYFPSNDVTYDNTESGLKSTDVQGAIDELYNTCINPPTADDELIDKVVTSGDGLYEDEYEEGKYTYKGANPNNYITFNNEFAGWRIVSIEKGIIKLIHDLNIGNQYFDDGSDYYSKEYGASRWYTDSYTASLNTYLNNTYYNNLTENAKNLIVSYNFNTGFVDDRERYLTTQINDEKSNTWNGKVGLVTVSEYIRANTNKSKCGSFDLYYTNYDTCKKTNWMSFDEQFWSITPYLGDEFVYTLSSSIGHSIAKAYQGNAVRPVVYINSDIKLKGTGTQTDPYIIE